MEERLLQGLGGLGTKSNSQNGAEDSTTKQGKRSQPTKDKGGNMFDLLDDSDEEDSDGEVVGKIVRNPFAFQPGAIGDDPDL